MLNRRQFLTATTLALATGPALAAETKKRTRFQIACMTLPYSQFPLQRALSGIRAAGYQYVAWGTTQKENGKELPVIAPDAPPGNARVLGERCRDLGLIPVLMF